MREKNTPMETAVPKFWKVACSEDPVVGIPRQPAPS